MKNEEYLNTTKAAKFLGVSNATLRNWDKQGILIPEKTNGDHRRYSLNVLQNYYNNKSHNKENKLVIAYCRVSSSDQKSDLETQINNVETYCIAKGYQFQTITDLGSGLNYNKKGLSKLINMIINKEISKIVINYKDRLIRFGFELIEQICSLNNIEIEIINNNETKNHEKELVDDVLSVITVFSARLYGSRSHKTNNLTKETKKLFN